MLSFLTCWIKPFSFFSNAIKFTHEGKVGVKLYVVPEPPFAKEGSQHRSDGSTANQSTTNVVKEGTCISMSQTSSDQKGFHSKKREGSCQNLSLSDEPGTPVINGTIDGDEKQAELPETTVWIRCDVYDTGIGIPGMMYACLLSLHCQKKSEILLDISVGPVWGVLDTFSCLSVTENALPTLFKKYMQVSADHARKYGGTGLGLAICKQLV